MLPHMVYLQAQKSEAQYLFCSLQEMEIAQILVTESDISTTGRFLNSDQNPS